jgi:hypothetical protein
MTVFVYVNTAKQVGDPTTSRCLQRSMPRKDSSIRTTAKGVTFAYEMIGP